MIALLIALFCHVRGHQHQHQGSPTVNHTGLLKRMDLPSRMSPRRCSGGGAQRSLDLRGDTEDRGSRRSSERGSRPSPYYYSSQPGSHHNLARLASPPRSGGGSRKNSGKICSGVFSHQSSEAKTEVERGSRSSIYSRSVGRLSNMIAKMDMDNLPMRIQRSTSARASCPGQQLPRLKPLNSPLLPLRARLGDNSHNAGSLSVEVLLPQGHRLSSDGRHSSNGKLTAEQLPRPA
eukprot:gene11329-18606_t